KRPCTTNKLERDDDFEEMSSRSDPHFFFQVSVPLAPLSDWRHHFPVSDPSGPAVITIMMDLPSAEVPTASTSPITRPAPTYVPLSHSSSSAPEDDSEMSRVPGAPS